MVQDGFKPFALRFRFETPEEAEEFLLGCIIARSNNNSSKWPKIIDGVNEAMTDYRRIKLQREVAARDRVEV